MWAGFLNAMAPIGVNLATQAAAGLIGMAVDKTGEYLSKTLNPPAAEHYLSSVKPQNPEYMGNVKQTGPSFRRDVMYPAAMNIV